MIKSKCSRRSSKVIKFKWFNLPCYVKFLLTEYRENVLKVSFCNAPFVSYERDTWIGSGRVGSGRDVGHDYG